MNQEIYADAVSAIHVTGNTVRIDLMSLQPQLKSENGQPVYDISRRIIMPLDGFIKAVAVQEQVLQQLIAAGTVKKVEQPVAPVSPISSVSNEAQAEDETEQAVSHANVSKRK